MRALVRRHIESGFNSGDWTVCEMLRSSFPDVAITIEDLVVEDDKIVMRYVERATLTGRPFLGIEPAGQRYEKPGTTVYRVADGRLAESWGVEDTLGWFRQLGKYTQG